MRKRVTAVVLALAGIFSALHARVIAQTPLVFFHGFASGDGTWDEAADRLVNQYGLNIWPAQHPDFAWWIAYEDQANEVDRAYGYLADPTLGLAHSNGGIVAREWSLSHSLQAVATIGTPHSGVPIAHPENFEDYLTFTQNQIDAIVHVADTFYACWDCPAYGYDGNWDWILDEVDAAGRYAVGRAAASAWTSWAYDIVGFGLPVFAEADPDSDFFSYMDSESHVGTEQSSIGSRIAITSKPERFLWGGILRTVDPDNGDDLASFRDGASQSLWYFVSYLESTADATYDWHASDLEAAMANAASYLDDMDYVWCANISFPSSSILYGWCTDNDTFMPVWSQDWHLIDGGVSTVPLTGLGAPAHTQETSWGIPVFYDVLSQFTAEEPKRLHDHER